MEAKKNLADLVSSSTLQLPVVAVAGSSISEACNMDDEVAMRKRVGSPGYVAPEIIMHKPYNEKVACSNETPCAATLELCRVGEDLNSE